MLPFKNPEALPTANWEGFSFGRSQGGLLSEAAELVCCSAEKERRQSARDQALTGEALQALAQKIADEPAFLDFQASSGGFHFLGQGNAGAKSDGVSIVVQGKVLQLFTF